MKQTRRQFFTTAGTASAGLALSGMVLSGTEAAANTGFGIRIYATRWGFEGTYDSFCKKVKEAGYDGVEDWVTEDPAQEAFFEALDKYNLRFGALTGSSGNNIEEHLNSYSQNLENTLSRKPDFINCHAGKDFLTFEESSQLIQLGMDKSKTTGIPIYQETHRGRMLFAAHVGAQFLRNFPDLRLTLDISHWCAVAESLLGNQTVAVTAALQRTDHVHARVGHEEGAQVPDPRAPEWKKANDAHYAWWDQVVALKKSRGEMLTMTTEFGPPNYMWTTPYSYQPLANQWEINVHMMNEWRERYLS